MPPKSKVESESDNCEGMVKMIDLFERFTSKIIEQMNSNFTIQNELLSVEMFNLKEKVDSVLTENAKIKKENECLKHQQDVMQKRMMELEDKLDGLEQDKLKDDIVISGGFHIEPLTPNNISAFIQKNCEASVSPNSITNFYSSKNKKGDSMLKVTVTNREERISLLKCKKSLAQKKVFVSEALTTEKFKLLMAAKYACKERKILSAWTRDGKLFIKKSVEERPLFIKSHLALQNLVDKH
jgi:regulator of replication initiation timing